MSSHQVAVLVATALPVVALGVLVWLLAVVIPRQRRYYASHPERRPHGWALLLRMSPFIAICAFAFITGIVTRSAASILLGGGGTLAFAISLRQRWNPPDA